MSTLEKDIILAIERSSPSDAHAKDEGKIYADEQGFASNVEDLSKGYYTSPFFIGTCCVVGFEAWAGDAGFAYAALLLATINADIRPDPNIQ
jgi:hypothetical protein